MTRPYNQQDATFGHVKGASKLIDGRSALRNYQRSLGVPVPEDHPERSADGPGGRRRKGRLSAQLGR